MSRPKGSCDPAETLKFYPMVLSMVRDRPGIVMERIVEVPGYRSRVVARTIRRME